MKCKFCTHENTCKYKSRFNTYSNLLKIDCEDNALYVECNFYEEIQVFEEEPHIIRTDYKLALNNGLNVYRFETLEELGEECKNRLRNGYSSYFCYENILYSDGKVKINVLPF